MMILVACMLFCSSQKPRDVSQYIALKTVIASFITINIYRTSYGVKLIFLNLFSIFRFMKVMKRY